MIRRSVVCFAIVIFAIIGAGRSVAQDPDDIQNGIKAYGTYRGGEVDSVSMTNGNLTLDIPLVAYPQRGQLHLSYKLVYNNKNFSQITKCIGVDGCTTFVHSNSSGLAAVPEQGFGGTSVELNGLGDVGFYSYSLSNTDGASHQLAGLSTTNYESVDGTGLEDYIPSTGAGYVTDADGTRYGGLGLPEQAGTQEDVNGNQISAAAGGGVLDTVGRTIPPLPTTISATSGSGSCPSGPLPVSLYGQWVVPGPNGGTSTYLFCWVQVEAWVIYNSSTDTYASGSHPNLQSLVLPNGTAWTFQYSTDNNGDLVQITFPTGGTISYVWNGGGSCTGLLVPPRWLASRTVNANDGTGNHTWSYSYSGPTTVTDPLGNNTVYTNTAESSCSFYTTQVQYYQGAVLSSNLLKTVSTTYSRTGSPFSSVGGPATYMNIVPTQVTTTWAANGKTNQITKGYDSGFTFPSPNGNGLIYTGLYGKVIAQKEYDYGTSSGVPGPLLRQTNTNYAWQSPNPNSSSYLTNNLLNLVYSSQITDGTTQMAFTQYGHDETATIASGMGAGRTSILRFGRAPIVAIRHQ